MKDVVLVSAVRTAIGDFGGSLRDFTPTDLGVATAKAAIERAGIPADDIDQAFYGNVIHIEHEYAQMAVHLRANGVVPPSSAGRR